MVLCGFSVNRNVGCLLNKSEGVQIFCWFGIEWLIDVILLEFGAASYNIGIYEYRYLGQLSLLYLCFKDLFLKYSTAQLQGNVRTRLKRVQDASGTHVRRVHASAKPCNKAATRRTRVPRPFFARRWARPERVWNASETCANVTLELSCTVTSNATLSFSFFVTAGVIIQCNRSCENGGTCTGLEQCSCTRDYFGQYCTGKYMFSCLC